MRECEENLVNMVQESHRFYSWVQVSFVQLFPTHILSLEFVLGFCHRIAKRGNCKVEFIQSFCWLYFMPNFLVIQHLETLYLGRNHVRVVCERV